MANITRLTEQLFTGGDLPSHLSDSRMLDDLSEMREAGITHIIDNRSEWSDEQFVNDHAADFDYLHNGQDDAGQQMPDEWFDRGVSFALTALRTPGNAVLAHCHMGINRGPSMAFAILLAQGCDPVEGLDTIRDARPIAAIGYGADALDWWHRRSGAAEGDIARERTALWDWFDEHPLDVVRAIRTVGDSQQFGR